LSDVFYLAKNILMKKLIPLLLVFLAPLFSRAQQNDASTLTKIGDTAPAFDFSISKTQKANIKDYRGKIVLINFFATWCPPCRLELPRVQKEIWEKYKDNPKFALFIFGREEGWEKVQAFKEKNQYTFFMLPDEGRKIFSLYATQSIPRNVVLDEDGKIIYQSIGYSEKDFTELLNVLAGKLK
jgi:peroxiredoxin